jgi:ApaG protein
VFEKSVTQGIQVEVQSSFLPDQSDRSEGHFVFSYHIRIRNDGNYPVQLLNRHWVIMDGRGRIEEVKGAGVIGQQPKLGPGESFEYESFCPLATPTGSMRGAYEMVYLTHTPTAAEGDRFQVEIPQFFLVEPESYH